MIFGKIQMEFLSSRILVIGMISFFSMNQIFAQDLNSFEEYETAFQRVILVTNKHKLIPITNIKNDEIGVLFSTQPKFNAFVNELEKYVLVDKKDFSSKLDEKTAKDWLTKKKYIIIAYDKIGENNVFVKTLRDNPLLVKKLITVFFTEEVVMDITMLKPDLSFILAMTDNPWVPSLAAQTIFGAAPIMNLSEKKILQDNLRLGYAPPESVGMNSNMLNQKIDSIANASIEVKAFPGMQVLIAKSGKIVFHKAYGFHTYENKKKVELTDLYDFASVSKITTALPALMKLHGEGKFDLDQPFKTYFPKFKKSNKADLNYREILAHQAGLKPWIPYWTTTIKKNGKYKWRTLKNRKTRNYNIKITDNLFLHKKYKKCIYEAICKSPVSEVKEYKYSGLAFYLFPEIVENLTEMDFETYLKEEIYQPIGATTLTYNPQRFFPKERIIPTERDTFFRKIQIHGTVHDEGAIMMGGISANAGLFGSATDLAKLMQLYLNGGSYGGQQIISQESIAEFTKYQFPENNNRRGLGFDKPLLEYSFAKSSVAKDATPSSYGHSGYTGTFVWVDPEYDLIYIFFSNRVYPTRNNRKIYELNVRPNIHQVIYDSMKQ